MMFQDVKVKLLSLFQYEKVDGRMGSEWGFHNEMDQDIAKVGYATKIPADSAAMG